MNTTASIGGSSYDGVDAAGVHIIASLPAPDSSMLIMPAMMALAGIGVWVGSVAVKRLGHAWRQSGSKSQDWTVACGGALFSAAAFGAMLTGLGEYRSALDAQLGGADGSGYATCYEVETELREGADSLFGQHLAYTAPHGDPWFDNSWMALYTGLCFLSLAAGTAYALWWYFSADVQREELPPAEVAPPNRRLTAHSRTISEDALSIGDALRVERLRTLVMLWVGSLSGVAFIFAPMPISRVLTFTGVSHNVVEWMLTYELVFGGGDWRPFISRTARSVFGVWVAVEFLGAIVFGPIGSQWLVFGVMGAVADLALVTAACAFYARKPTRHRAQLLRAILSHFLYVVLYFVNCRLGPPLAKVLGLYLNVVALWLAADYIVPRPGTVGDAKARARGGRKSD